MVLKLGCQEQHSNWQRVWHFELVYEDSLNMEGFETSATQQCRMVTLYHPQRT